VQLVPWHAARPQHAFDHPLLLCLLLLLLVCSAAVLYTLLALDIDPVERLLQLLPMSEVCVMMLVLLLFSQQAAPPCMCRACHAKCFSCVLNAAGMCNACLQHTAGCSTL
jgi:hypothetical protein